VLGGGRLRAPPVADAASNKEWQRSKFCEANSEEKFSGTATGFLRQRLKKITHRVAGLYII